MNYCSNCGTPVELRVPAGDNRPRWCCVRCGAVHYENPKIVMGTLPVWEDRVLLCKRAIEPRLGFWTLPAGFMENGETIADGALRETIEEAGARVVLQDLFAAYDVIEVHQVHVYFRARLLDLEFAPGPESLDVRLFREQDIPWDQLAFRTVVMTLRAYFADRAQGTYTLHTGAVSSGRHGAGT